MIRVLTGRPIGVMGGGTLPFKYFTKPVINSLISGLVLRLSSLGTLCTNGTVLMLFRGSSRDKPRLRGAPAPSPEPVLVIRQDVDGSAAVLSTFTPAVVVVVVVGTTNS